MTGQLLAGPATVASVMIRRPSAVAPHTPFKHVLELLAEQDVDAVAVVSATGIVVGEVSEVDLLRHHRRLRRRREPGRLTASELMTSPVTVVPLATPLADAERMLVKRSRLYVVDQGRLVGVLPRHAVLSGFLRQDKEIQADIEHQLTDDVRANVQDGIVLLTGRLPHRADIDAVLADVAGTPGVIAIRNRVVPELRS